MFKYFGSKHRLASTYDPPVHDVIIEPFAGAAAYAMYWLTRRPDKTAVLVDSDSVVVDLWTRLLGMDPQDLWDYPYPIRGERTDDSIYLISTSGVAECNTFTKHGDVKVTEWMVRDFGHMRERVASTLAAVRGRVAVHHGDYAEVPDLEATWFIDPPYQKEGHQYASKNALDFTALGEWCQGLVGQVIVCESLGADWLDFTPHRMPTTVANTSSTEVVWYSHPEPTLLDHV